MPEAQSANQSRRNLRGSRDEVLAFIAQGEGPGVEFKSEAAKPGKLAEALIAFANAEGGLLIIGVDARTGRIAGVTRPKEAQAAVIEATRLCDPPLIIPLPELVPLDNDQRVLLVQVPEGLPHVYNLSGRYLTRLGTLNKPLAAPDLKRLLIQRGEISFEALSAHSATYEDLDQHKIKRYLDSLAHLRREFDAPAEEILRNRGCLLKSGERYQPTNAGLLLFGKATERFYKQAEVTLVRYPGTQPGDEFLREDLRQTLPEQIREAEVWLVANMRKGSRLEGLAREDFTEYPVEAVREAVVNAVAHRDYSIRGEGIRVTMFADRIEFYSPGRLPGQVTVQNIVDERFSRNEAIVQVLSDLGLIERLGYGINRMIRLMADWDLPPPTFQETASGFLVTLRGRGVVEEAGVEPKVVPSQMRQWARLGLNERQLAGMEYIVAHGRITNREYRELYPDITDETVRRDLADLVDKNLILRIGDKRATYYILK